MRPICRALVSGRLCGLQRRGTGRETVLRRTGQEAYSTGSPDEISVTATETGLGAYSTGRGRAPGSVRKIGQFAAFAIEAPQSSDPNRAAPGSACGRL